MKIFDVSYIFKGLQTCSMLFFLGNLGANCEGKVTLIVIEILQCRVNDSTEAWCPSIETIHMDERTLVTCELNASTDVAALRSIQRATTESCKNRIMHMACKQKTGGYLPEKYLNKPVPMECPYLKPVTAASEIRSSYVGCFRMIRKLPQTIGVHNNVPNIQECIFRCYFEGAQLAAMVGKVCACLPNTDYLTHVGVRVDNPFQATFVCVELCPVAYTDPGVWPCGGLPFGNQRSMSVFKTGFEDDTQLRQAARLNKEEVTKQMARISDHQRQSFQILYIFLLNGRNYQQVHRLFKAVYSPRHYYYIHIDERAKYMWMKIVHEAGLFSENRMPANVMVAKQCHRLVWGGASLPFMLKQVAAETAHWPWSYAIRMTERDLPILPVREFEIFLAANLQFGNYSFVPITKKGNNRDIIKRQGMEQLYTQCDDHLWTVGDRYPSFLRNVVAHASTDLFVAHREMIDYASFSQDPLPNSLWELMYTSAHALESQYTTLAYNSKLCTKFKDHMPRYNNFRRPRSCQCELRREPPTSDRCVCSPVRLRPHDIKGLERRYARTQHVYFARKFDALFDLDLVNTILAQSESGPPMEVYSENFYHSKIDPHSELFDVVAGCMHSDNNEPTRVIEISHVRFAGRRNATQNDFRVKYATENDVQHEMLVKPKLRAMRSAGSGLSQLQIGTDYDAKEFSLRDATLLNLQVNRTNKIATMVALWRHAKREDMVFNKKNGVFVTMTIKFDDRVANASYVTRVQQNVAKQRRVGKNIFNINIFDLAPFYRNQRFVDADINGSNTTGSYELTLNITDARTWTTDWATINFPVFPSEHMLLGAERNSARKITCDLVRENYKVADRCSSEVGNSAGCRGTVWSSFYDG